MAALYIQVTGNSDLKFLSTVNGKKFTVRQVLDYM